MNNNPILILQMQRMGDLVLSFPLLERLIALYPGHPLWVAGEQTFFEPLMFLSPTAAYFSYADAVALRQQRFHAVINLSHRREAAALAGQVACDSLTGPWLDRQGRLFINGDWQLYRASISHNNRYNLFHWADLNMLDSIPPDLLEQLAWPLPKTPDARALRQQGARIGLFLGASETEKHPDADFWADLADLLLNAGHRPVLLGGKAEEALGRAAAAKLKAPALNLCGNFRIRELARFIRELDLFITPDTGPMHIAAWAGTPVLNLSLGPVNPWETGPASPGHHVVRAAIPCAGCWRCTQGRLVCRERLTAASVVRLAQTLLRERTLKQNAESFGGLEVLRSTRGRHGLYGLRFLHEPSDTPLPAWEADSFSPGETPSRRLLLSLFWQAWFGREFGPHSEQELAAARQKLRDRHPEAEQELKTGAASFALSLARTFRADPARLLAEPDFWRTAPETLHPLSGYIQMYAQNNLGSRRAFTHALSLVEKVAEPA